MANGNCHCIFQTGNDCTPVPPLMMKAAVSVGVNEGSGDDGERGRMVVKAMHFFPSMYLTISAHASVSAGTIFKQGTCAEYTALYGDNFRNEPHNIHSFCTRADTLWNEVQWSCALHSITGAITGLWTC